MIAGKGRSALPNKQTINRNKLLGDSSRIDQKILKMRYKKYWLCTGLDTFYMVNNG